MATLAAPTAGSPAKKAPAAPGIPVRNLHFGITSETPRYWFGERAGPTQFMNALSSTFPGGEAFFVRSVQHYRARIEDPDLEARIRGFAGQEGVHAREHGSHVDVLDRQGYPGIRKINQQADREMRFLNRHLPLWSLAVTASLEHITAIMARQALSDPDYWAGPMHEDMAPLWQWHAMEEAEHKSVAFDVLERVSNSYPRRAAAMAYATFGLLMDNLVRWVYLTAKDGNLTKPGIWADTARFLWGRNGLYRRILPDYRRWFRRGFHPDDQDDSALIREARERLAPSVPA